MTMNVLDGGRIGLSGRYRVKVGSKARGERVVAEFDNLITDTGLDWFGAGGYMTTCHVGTGSTAPLFTDVRMTTFKAQTSSVLSSTGVAPTAPDYILAITRTWRFAEGVAAGNLSEIGIGKAWHATNPYLFSHALIVDGGGAPTTLVILADEYLDVEYTLNWGLPRDSTGTVTLAGVDYTWTARAANALTWTYSAAALTGGFNGIFGMSSWVGPIGPITGNPTGVNGSGTNGTKQTYVNGTFYNDFIMTFGLTTANLAGGIGSLLFRHCSDAGFGTYPVQIGFVPNIPKTASKVLTLTHRISWGRA